MTADDKAAPIGVQNLRELASVDATLTAQKSPKSDGIVLGYVMAGIGAILFAMKAILVKLAYLPGGGLEANALDVVTLLALRMGFALPIYVLIWLWVIRRQGGVPPLALLAKSAALGMVGYYLCSYLDFTGLKMITAQLERLLLFTYPVFVVILGVIFYGRKLTFGTICAILLAYAGIAIIFLGGDIATGYNVLLGSILVILTAFFFAIFQFLSKPMITKVGSQNFTCAAMIAASTAILTHFIVTNIGNAGGVGAALDLPPRVYLVGASIAFISTLLPSFLINMALERISAEAVGIVGMLNPVATITAAIILLGEPFGALDGVGTAVTMLGIGLYTWLDRRREALEKAKQA